MLLHDHRSAEKGPRLFRDHAADDVGRSGWGKRDDHAHRTIWILGSSPRDEGGRERRGAYGEKIATLHGSTFPGVSSNSSITAFQERLLAASWRKKPFMPLVSTAGRARGLLAPWPRAKAARSRLADGAVIFLACSARPALSRHASMSAGLGVANEASPITRAPPTAYAAPWGCIALRLPPAIAAKSNGPGLTRQRPLVTSRAP